MYTDLELDKPRRLRFDLQAYRDLEHVLTIPVGDVVNHIQRMSVSVIIAALWAGLKHEDKPLTQNLVAKILSGYLEAGGNIRIVVRALNDAFNESALFKHIADPDAAVTEGNETPEPTTTEILSH